MVEGLVPFDYFGVMTWQQVQRTSGNAAGSSAIAAQAMGGSRLSSSFPLAMVAGSTSRTCSRTRRRPSVVQSVLARRSMIPRYASQPLFETAELAQEWEDLVWAALQTKTYAEWEPILLADDNIAFEMARRSEEGIEHVQIVHNGDVVTVSDPRLGPVVKSVRWPTSRVSPARIDRSAPGLGEHHGELSRQERADPAGGGARPPAGGVTIVELGTTTPCPTG